MHALSLHLISIAFYVLQASYKKSRIRRYKKKAVHIYYYFGGNVDGDDAVNTLHNMLKNPSSLLSSKNLKKVIGKRFSFSVIFFGLVLE